MNIDVGIVNASFSISAIINELYRLNKQSDFLLPAAPSGGKSQHPTPTAAAATGRGRGEGRTRSGAVTAAPPAAPAALATLNLLTLSRALWNVELQHSRTGEPSRCVVRLPPLSFPLPPAAVGEGGEDDGEEVYMAFGYVAVLYASGAGRVLGSSSAAAVVAAGQWLQRLLAALLLGPAVAAAALPRLCAAVHRAPALLPPPPAAVTPTAEDSVRLQVLHAAVHPDVEALTALQRAAGLSVAEGSSGGGKRGREELFMPVQGEACLQFIERYVAVRRAPTAAAATATTTTLTWPLSDFASEAEMRFLQRRDVALQRHLRAAHISHARRRSAVLLKLKWAVSAAGAGGGGGGGGGGARDSTVLYLPSALPTNFVMPSAEMFFAEPSTAAMAPPPPPPRMGAPAGMAAPGPRPAVAATEDVSVTLFSTCRAVVVCKSVQAATEVAQHVLLPLLLCKALPA